MENYEIEKLENDVLQSFQQYQICFNSQRTISFVQTMKRYYPDLCNGDLQVDGKYVKIQNFLYFALLNNSITLTVSRFKNQRVFSFNKQDRTLLYKNYIGFGFSEVSQPWQIVMQSQFINGDQKVQVEYGEVATNDIKSQNKLQQISIEGPIKWAINDLKKKEIQQVTLRIYAIKQFQKQLLQKEITSNIYQKYLQGELQQFF